MLDEDSQRAQRGEREREAGRGGGYLTWPGTACSKSGGLAYRQGSYVVIYSIHVDY